MTPPCKRCLLLGMCLNKLRSDTIPKKYKVYDGKKVETPHFDISYTNVAMRMIKECKILSTYMIKRKRDWTVSLKYSPEDIDSLCDFCEKTIHEIRDGGKSEKEKTETRNIL